MKYKNLELSFVTLYVYDILGNEIDLSQSKII